MAKGQDPFEKFKAATLSSSPSIKDAISSDTKPSKESKLVSKPAEKPLPSPAAVPAPAPKADDKGKKANNLEQVSFFIDKDLKKAVGLLKYERDVQLKDLYEEAIRDLLVKYHKL